MDTMGADIEATAGGSPPSARMIAEVERLKCSSIDESAGEGWHRGTNVEHVRAASAKTVHLEVSTRVKQCIRGCRQIIARYGERGKKVIRYEWKKNTSVSSRCCNGGGGFQL